MAKNPTSSGRSGGRTTQATALAKKNFLEALSKTLGIVTHACRLSGVGVRTVYDWKDSDPEFVQAMNDVTNEVKDFAESNLLKQIGKGNVSATIFYLKTQCRDRGYIEKVDHVHEGIDIPRTFEILPIASSQEANNTDNGEAQ